MESKRILAIVVTYYPENDLLVRNVQAFIEHVDKVLIWENTPSPDKLQYRFITHEKVEYYGDGINSISRALNFAWEYANENGFDYMLTMDQDSYFENFDFYVGKTVLCKDAPEGIWTPQMNGENVSSEYEEIDIPITSGMLASVKIVNAIGGWNESYTIASVDDEFFLQAHQCKIKKYKVKDASLLQRFGITQVVTVFGHKLELRNYGPQRLYDIYRNNIILIRKYPKIDYLRKNFFHYWLKAIVLVFLFEKQRFKKTAAIFKGIISGLRYKNEELRNLGIASLKKDTNVLVLMSTYNGEAYLRKQLDSILPETDILVISLPGTAETLHMLNARRLAMLPDHALIINVGRGTVIDQPSLEAELRKGRLFAALDVFEQEPLPDDDPLWNCPNLLITPHVAGDMTLPYTRQRIVELFLEDFENYCAGRPLARQVDLKRGY